MKNKFDLVIEEYLQEAPGDAGTPPQPAGGEQPPMPAPGGEQPPMDAPAPETPEDKIPEGLATSFAMSMIKAMKWVRNNPRDAEVTRIITSELPSSDQDAINLLDEIENLSSREIDRAQPNEFHGPAVKPQ